jgi:multidrug efflux pump subunit AcrA (membrane-fusion protein)
MENFSTHNFNEIFFIKVFFVILMAGFLLIAIIVMTFNINDSVTFESGEIMPEVPRQDYKAPFDAIPRKILVREGQRVNAADTLVILDNEQVQKNWEEAQSAYEGAVEARNAAINLITITKQRIENLQQERILNSNVHLAQKEKLSRELEYATQKAELDREKLLNVGLAKLKMDSTLFRNELISQLEMTNSYDNYLNYKNVLLEAENARDQLRSDSENLENEYLKSQNLLDLKLIELNERLEQLNNEKSAAEKALKTASENLNFYRTEARKHIIITELDFMSILVW